MTHTLVAMMHYPKFDNTILERVQNLYTHGLPELQQMDNVIAETYSHFDFEVHFNPRRWLEPHLELPNIEKCLQVSHFAKMRFGVNVCTLELSDLDSLQFWAHKTMRRAVEDALFAVLRLFEIIQCVVSSHALPSWELILQHGEFWNSIKANHAYPRAWNLFDVLDRKQPEHLQVRYWQASSDDIKRGYA